MKMENQLEFKGRHYATGQPVRIVTGNGIIQKIAELEEPGQDLPYIAPGLVDLQINGYRGMDYNTPPVTEEMVGQITKALYHEGITSYYPTVITNPPEFIAQACQTVATACRRQAHVHKTIAGIHLEGPFISPEDGPRGAHQARYVRAPDWDTFRRWQEAAEGKIKIITMSPEWPGACSFIENCSREDVVVSIGHTAASPEQIRDAVSAGARLSTHLGNGAHPRPPAPSQLHLGAARAG